MSHVLKTVDGRTRVLAPTTTVKLARRMLAASRVAADKLPLGLYGSPGLDILLALFIAEEDAQYLVASELTPPGSPALSTTVRWTKALGRYGYIETRDDLVALTAAGHAKVTELVEAMFAVQRALD